MNIATVTMFYLVMVITVHPYDDIEVLKLINVRIKRINSNECSMYVYSYIHTYRYIIIFN